MVTIRSSNEIILSLIDFLRVKQPNLDTKPGTVSRDLFVEAPASQLSLLYDELSKISDLQSLRLSVGEDLDNLAANYGISRKAATKASGVALLTFSSIPAPIAINKNSLIISSNGLSFSVLNGVSVNPSSLNLYRAVATRYRSDLDFLGITDLYAVEVAVAATTPGVIGNISKFGINRTSIPGVSNVTNVFPFSGGANQEDDATFRNRALAVFSGSNVGTSLGYKNTVLTDSSVIDALVIEPGDPLMVRDGTQVVQNPDRSFTIISEGQGGKVDIIVLGTRLSEYIDTFIYRDASNNNDPTDTKNIFTLGQIAGDENKTVNRKRLDNLKSGILPAQPVEEIFEVTGSLSGSNFKPKSVDSLGRVTGNYELIKDTGVYSGSPWGFDKFHWISDRISLFQEDKVKGRYNGQDNTNFTDILDISQVQQSLSIQNENSSLAYALGTDGSVLTDSSGNKILDNTHIQLSHTPATSVTRVFNVTTGERYTVTSQNPDGTGTVNTTGRVTISGNTYPSPSDVLQVDYTWLYDYDPYVDYDGRFVNDNPRTVQDSIDWGYSNAIRSEEIVMTKNGSGTYYDGTASLPIGAITSVNYFSSATATVTLATGVNAGKLAVVVSNLTSAPLTVDSITLRNTNHEVYDTAQADGSFTSVSTVVGLVLRYVCTIILPSDTTAQVGDSVQVIFDEKDMYTVNGVSGNFTGNQITVPVGNYSGGPSQFTARVNYTANVQNLFSVNLTDLPLVRRGNGYLRSSFASVDIADDTLVVRREHATVTSSNILKLTLSSSEATLTASDIIAAIRLSDGVELWNSSNVGTVGTDTDGVYQLTLSGAGTPATGDSVLVLYTAEDISRAQPMTFDFTAIAGETASVTLSLGGDLYVEGLTFPANTKASKVAVFRLSDGLELTQNAAQVDTASGTITFTDEVEDLLTGGEAVYVLTYRTTPLRRGLTRIATTLSDQVANEGIITFAGTTVTKGNEVIFTAINSGLTQNLAEAVRSVEGLLSSESVPTSRRLMRLVKLEKVSVVGTDVISVDATYDVRLSKMLDASYCSTEALEDSTLSGLDFTLPSTTNNVANAPVLGDKLRATFYYVTKDDSEDVLFTRNGVVYGNKLFATIDKVYVSSGFNTVSTGRITASVMNQPAAGTRYRSYYDYLAPKPNERIIIRYNYNKLIADATVALEPSRPISADVLIKAATQLKVNLSLAIVVKTEYSSSTNVVLQNVKDKVTTAINTNILGDTIDSSDLSAVAQGVTGVDRVRVTAFNLEGETGQVLSIAAQKNEYFVANTIEVVAEGR